MAVVIKQKEREILKDGLESQFYKSFWARKDMLEPFHGEIVRVTSPDGSGFKGTITEVSSSGKITVKTPTGSVKSDIDCSKNVVEILGIRRCGRYVVCDEAL